MKIKTDQEHRMGQFKITITLDPQREGIASMEQDQDKRMRTIRKQKGFLVIKKGFENEIGIIS